MDSDAYPKWYSVLLASSNMGQSSLRYRLNTNNFSRHTKTSPLFQQQLR